MARLRRALRASASASATGLAVAALLAVTAAPVVAAQASAPTAFFELSSATIDVGGSTVADARGSTGQIVEYAWRWNASAEYAVGNRSESHRFDEPGVVLVGLRVRDASGAVAFANQTLLVRAGAPEAYLSPLVYEERDGGRFVRLTAEFSTPSRAGTRIATFEWRWEDDEAFFVGNVSEEHLYAETGRHVVTLRVTDDAGQQSSAVYVVDVGSTFWTRMGEVWDDRASFLEGARVTLILAIGTTIVGFALAIVLALMRVSHLWFLRWPALAYIEVIRGTPLFLQILITWLVLPVFGLKLSVFYAGALALVINTVAYQAEAIRAGIQAIPTGQMEAAISLGMTYVQAMRHVVVPQAFRLSLPALGNEFIILLKDTSLVSAIGVVELTFIGRAFANRTFLVVEPFLAVGLIYFVMTYTLSYGLRHLERRFAIPGMGVGGGVGV